MRESRDLCWNWSQSRVPNQEIKSTEFCWNSTGKEPFFLVVLVGLLIYAEVVARLMAKTATRPWHMNSLHYDYHILSFTDVEAEKCNDHISNSEDVEVIVEYNPGSCRASPHGKCLVEGQWRALRHFTMQSTSCLIGFHSIVLWISVI